MSVKKGRLPVFKERFNKLAEGYKNYTAFADAIGLSRQSVNFWLNGDRTPDAESLKMISQKLNVSVDWLLGLSDIRKPDPSLAAAASYTGLLEETAENIRKVSLTDPKAQIGINVLLGNDFINLLELCTQIVDAISAKGRIPEIKENVTPEGLAERLTAQRHADGLEWGMIKTFLSLVNERGDS